jgi:hypothetical protein
VRQPRLRVIFPVWAQRIDVEKQRDTILVTGWGRIASPIDAREVEPGQVSRLDIFQRFHRYFLSQLGEKKAVEDAGVYQFADADNDEKLITFVKEFGPVWGQVRSSKYEENGTCTLTVAQSLRGLRQEQREFAAAAELLRQVNRNSQADSAIIASTMLDIGLPAYWQVMTDTFLSTEGSVARKTESVLPWARRALCMVLNHYPPRLVPVDGEVIELAGSPDEGIRDAIYYQLRRDFLAQRTIGICLNCGGHFAVHKRGTRGCSESCRRALRNQKYWSKHKKTVNRNRRKRREGGK